MKNVVITTAVAAAAFLLTACGPSQPQSQGTPEPSSTSSTPTASSAPATSQAPSSTPPSSSSAPAEPAPAPARCKAANLAVTEDSSGGGAAGSVYSQLILTNTGTAPCLLRGFPGVSLTADANGAPIGAPARQDGSSPVADVLLAPGKAGAADMRYTQAGNYPDCAVTQAAGYRIYPPEDTASLFLAEPRNACANDKIELLTIGAFHVR